MEIRPAALKDLSAITVIYNVIAQSARGVFAIARDWLSGELGLTRVPTACVARR